MLNIGPHLTITNGFESAAKEAISIGANTFQYFTRNPRGGKAKALDAEDLKKYATLSEANGFAPIMAHAAYTMNLCSQDESVRAFARTIMRNDFERLVQIPNSLYVFHPGSHTGQGVDVGIAYIIDALNETLTEEIPPVICLEGMSGKGSEVGSTFEELRAIIDGVTYSDKMGVCLDTCHLYSAGYDVVNDLDGVLEAFDRIVGLKRLRAIHLNDSKMDFDSKKDRHEKIGEGTLGIEAITRIINHPKLKHLPFYLETPNEVPGYGAEIATLRALYKPD
jgi:deoxyribonuclease-4